MAAMDQAPAPVLRYQCGGIALPRLQLLRAAVRCNCCAALLITAADQDWSLLQTRALLRALSVVAHDDPALDEAVIRAARAGRPPAHLPKGPLSNGAKMPAHTHTHIHTGSNLFVGSSGSGCVHLKLALYKTTRACGTPCARFLMALAYLRRSDDLDEVEEDELDGRYRWRRGGLLLLSRGILPETFRSPA